MKTEKLKEMYKNLNSLEKDIEKHAQQEKAGLALLGGDSCEVRLLMIDDISYYGSIKKALEPAVLPLLQGRSDEALKHIQNAKNATMKLLDNHIHNEYIAKCCRDVQEWDRYWVYIDDVMNLVDCNIVSSYDGEEAIKRMEKYVRSHEYASEPLKELVKNCYTCIVDIINKIQAGILPTYEEYQKALYTTTHNIEADGSHTYRLYKNI